MDRFQTLKVTCHTDFVGRGTTFVALPGFQHSGIDFILQALEKGATKIVVQSDSSISEETLQQIKASSTELVCVQDAAVALAELAAQAYGHPAKKLKIVGVTGTKGKTTSVFLLNHIFKSAGYKTALLSGVYNLVDQQQYPCNLTTPKADYLHAFFAQCVAQDVEYVFMEASAHAFTLQRLYGIEFAGAIFTNLDLEHLEFYKDMDDYFAAKLQIADHLVKDGPLVVNIDNSWGLKFYGMAKDALSFSMNSVDADFVLSDLESKNDGLSFKLSLAGQSKIFQSNLIGKFNAINIAVVASLACKFGIELDKIEDALWSFGVVPGRMEKMRLSNGALAVVDYAHNPLSYNSVLPELKKIGKELIVVFGAGGGRDAARRPLMGQAAANWADKIILTSDNPRLEDAQKIVDDIISGMPTYARKKVMIELDREKAISLACKISSKQSVVAVLGKGPDNYQIIGQQTFSFSDKSVLASCGLLGIQKS